jgi:DNA mismatch repair ATPase MutL
MYVLLEDNDFLYVVDQHALAERIAYERMRTYSADHTSSHQLLQPVSIATSPAFPIEQYETTLSAL